MEYFAFHVIFFGTDLYKGIFVNKPVRVWNKISEKAKEHEGSSKVHRIGR